MNPISMKSYLILDSDADLQTIDATTLDRVHAAMLLQSSGHANTLRTLTGAGQDRGPDLLRLANVPSALYPLPQPWKAPLRRYAVSQTEVNERN